jgi:hypothetical protein
MVVLTVTTALFVSATMLVNGRQNKVEFTQAVGDIKGKLEQSINQVGSGYYADTHAQAGRTCSTDSGRIQFSATGNTEKGSSGDCIYLGQAFQFGLGNGGGNLQRYATHTVVARRTVSGSNAPVQNLDQAAPMLLFPNGLEETSSFPNGETFGNLQSGMEVFSVTSNGHPVGGFALLSNVGQYDAVGMLNSGTQSVNLYPLLPQGMESAVTTAPPYGDFRTEPENFSIIVNRNMRNLANSANPASGIQICFASGGTQQSARITVGGSGRALSVSQQFFEGNRQCQ